MTSVFLGFVGDPDVVVKTIGLGLASAILIDVLIVRMIVAPAVMTLLGDRAWALPAWLDRALPRDLAGGGAHPGVSHFRRPRAEGATAVYAHPRTAVYLKVYWHTWPWVALQYIRRCTRRS